MPDERCAAHVLALAIKEDMDQVIVIGLRKDGSCYADTNLAVDAKQLLGMVR